MKDDHVKGKAKPKAAEGGREMNWLGWLSVALALAAFALFVASIPPGLFLAVPASIVLGHVALVQVKKQKAANRGVALTGAIMGYVFLSTVISAPLIAAVEQKGARDAAVHDLSRIADEIEAYGADGDWTEIPEVVTGENGHYQVGDVTWDGESPDSKVTFEYVDDTDWCVLLEYNSGVDAFSYGAASGLQENRECTWTPSDS